MCILICMSSSHTPPHSHTCTSIRNICNNNNCAVLLLLCTSIIYSSMSLYTPSRVIRVYTLPRHTQTPHIHARLGRVISNRGAMNIHVSFALLSLLFAWHSANAIFNEKQQQYCMEPSSNYNRIYRSIPCECFARCGCCSTCRTGVTAVCLSLSLSALHMQTHIYSYIDVNPLQAE